MDFATEGNKVIGDIGGSPQSQVFGAGFQNGDRSFWRDTIHPSPDIFVQYQIADNENFRPIIAVEKMFKLFFHLQVFFNKFTNYMPDGYMNFLDSGCVV